MKRHVVTMALTLVCVGLFGAKAGAQTITFGTGQPAISTGSVSGSGSFDCGAGFTVYQVKLIVRGPLGGCPQRYDSTFSPLFQTQTGNWGPSAIANLPTGQYNVSVQLYY